MPCEAHDKCLTCPEKDCRQITIEGMKGLYMIMDGTITKADYNAKMVKKYPGRFEPLEGE